MPITKDKLIKLLNADLSKEYTAIVQYTQHTCPSCAQIYDLNLYCTVKQE